MLQMRMLNIKCKASESSKKQNPQSKKQSSNPQKRKRKAGRKAKRKEFEDTRLGRLLLFRAPIEFALIVDSCKGVVKPSADLIEQVGYASPNPFFKTPRFRLALIDYRKRGVYGVKIRPHSEEKKQNLMKKYYHDLTSGMV